MNFSKRIYKKELLDQNDIPFPDIKKNMQELNVINTLLGGHKITIEGFKQLAGKRKQLTVCEIGCGGGDSLAAINKAVKTEIAVKFIGIDIKQECIDFAIENPSNDHVVEWIISDYKEIYFKEKPDIIFSSLFCHHFTGEALIKQLQWMKENCSIGFFINDLHRHPVAYYSIKWLTAIFSSSYLVKNDAPLSVARGFKKKEWKNILKAAGITNYKIQWKWAFRYLILWQHA